MRRRDNSSGTDPQMFRRWASKSWYSTHLAQHRPILESLNALKARNLKDIVEFFVGLYEHDEVSIKVLTLLLNQASVLVRLLAKCLPSQ